MLHANCALQPACYECMRIVRPIRIRVRTTPILSSVLNNCLIFTNSWVSLKVASK